LARSIKYAPVRLMSSLIFLGLVFSGFFDWVIWHEVPTELALAGIALVIVGAIITVYFGQSDPTVIHH